VETGERYWSTSEQRKRAGQLTIRGITAEFWATIKSEKKWCYSTYMVPLLAEGRRRRALIESGMLKEDRSPNDAFDGSDIVRLNVVMCTK
jgi:hypothetical protein